MNVKEAVKAAKEHIVMLFTDEQITNLGLEEIEFDDEAKCWRVTVGFSRPWNMNALTGMMQNGRRSYKSVAINDDTGEIVSVKSRELQNAA